MTIQYSPDTDTALIDFCSGTVAETREISENIYVDIDMTVEEFLRNR